MPSTRRRAVAVLALAVALAVCASPAHAQRPRPDRPYRGLFGGNGADPNSTQAFDLSLSLFGGYDDNVLAQQSAGYVDPRFQAPSGYGGASLSLDYTKRAGRVTFDLTGGTTYRYYRDLEGITGFNYFGSVGLSAKLTPRTDFWTTQSASYSPFYSFAPFPGAAPQVPGGVAPIAPDYPLYENPALLVYSTASIQHRLTPRASLSADYTWSSVDYERDDALWRTWGAGGRFSYKLNSSVSARLGYHYRKSESNYYYAGRPIRGNDLDVGIDLNRPLSVSRKTTVGFSVGSTIYQYFEPEGAQAEGAGQYRTYFYVTGSAFLNRQIGRSWNANLNYQRGLRYVPGFTTPLFSDSVVASLGGFLQARSRLNLAAGYSRGYIGIQTRGYYDTVYASAGFQFALARWGALFADYGYYHYLFDRGVALPPGMSIGQDRQSVRGGLNLFLPLLR